MPRDDFNTRFIKPDLDERGECYKYMIFVFNFILFLCSCSLIGVGIWIAIDRNFLSFVTGNILYEVAVYFVIIGGGVIFLVTFLGCCGAATHSKCLLLIYAIILIFVFIVLFIMGVIAGVFTTQIGEAVREKMRDTLINRYGHDYHDWVNRAVTQGWDQTQEKLWCCGVETEGWGVYKESKWFQIFGAGSATKTGYEDQKAFVPLSCCVRDRFWRYIDIDTCQKWRFGPPGTSIGAYNRALYYRGCYEAGKQYLLDNSGIMIGIGIGFAVYIICGIFFSVCLLRRLNRSNSEKGPDLRHD